MLFDFTGLPRLARLQGAALSGLALAVGCIASPAQAARPMITDDARIVDPKACQLESWVKDNRGSTEYWALPACNFSGNLELTLGGGRVHENGSTRTSEVVAQGKTILKPLEANGWGIGLAAGMAHHPHAQGNRRDWYAYVPASFSFRDDLVVIHANLGWERTGESRRHRATWGLGNEVQLAERTWLIAETFGQNKGKAFHQFGLRHWLVPDRIQLDATYGNRNGSGTQERWFSIGLRLLSVPFLP